MAGPVECIRGYAICTAPRSGSNLLAQLLTSTGVLGRPLEYFNGPARRILGLPGYPDDPHLQIQAVLSLGMTPNGVYGFKIFPSQFEAIKDSGWTDKFPNLGFVHLRRDDLLGQALSWARARQTKQYRSTSTPVRAPDYDRALIWECLQSIVREQARWSLYFSSRGVAPLALSYEDMVSQPHTAVRAVADLIGVDAPSPVLSDVDLEVQRDGLTSEWRRRFLGEAGDLARMPDI